eukprot:760348-Hanusia_phi.AAC.9
MREKEADHSSSSVTPSPDANRFTKGTAGEKASRVKHSHIINGGSPSGSTSRKIKDSGRSSTRK